MFRPIGVALITLAIFGCGNKGESETGSPTNPQSRQTDASFEFRGKSYELTVPGDCGPTPDGSFRTWAFTLDADGVPIPDGPHLLALSEKDWAVIDFYPGEGEQVMRVYREGKEKLQFVNGVLEFDGPLGAGLTENVRISIECP